MVNDALYWCSYRVHGMKWFSVLLLTALWIPGSLAVEKLYQTGKIVDVQQKTNTRVLYYQVNTPITKDEPYFEVSVQIKDTIYVGDYTPRHSADTLPEEWNVPPVDVRLRLEKRSMFLTRPGGTELQFVIVKRTTVAPEQKISQPSSPKK